MLKRGAVTMAMVLAVGLGACSGSTGATTQSTTTRQVAPQDVVADTAAAKASALRLSDLPPSGGWTSRVTTDSPDSPAVNAQLAGCLGVNKNELANGPAHFESPSYSDSQNNTVSNSVDYLPSATNAEHQFALFEDAKMPGCLGTVIFDAIKKVPGLTDFTFGAPTVTPVSFPTVGDHIVAYRVKVAITATGQTATADFLVATNGRARVEMNFESVNTPYPPAQEQLYLQAVLQRLTNT